MRSEIARRAARDFVPALGPMWRPVTQTKQNKNKFGEPWEHSGDKAPCAVPGFSKRAFEIGDGPLSAWSQFCGQFGLQANHAEGGTEQPGVAQQPDWLGGTAIASTPGRALRVTLNSQPRITQAAANSYRPAVWCLYRVEQVPVHRRSDRALVGEQAVPVPLSVGVAKRDALTQYPPGGVVEASAQRLWCRGWDDTRPESDKWGTAVSSAAWIVEVMQSLTLPPKFWTS